MFCLVNRRKPSVRPKETRAGTRTAPTCAPAFVFNKTYDFWGAIDTVDGEGSFTNDRAS